MAAKKAAKQQSGSILPSESAEVVPVRKGLNIVRVRDGDMLWLGIDLSKDYGLTGGDNTRIASTLGNKRLDPTDDPKVRFQVNVFRLVDKD